MEYMKISSSTVPVTASPEALNVSFMHQFPIRRMATSEYTMMR